jgi:hypothetical protein
MAQEMAVRGQAVSRPPFAVVSAAFPRKDKVSAPALYEGIGHPEYAADMRMVNTCGVRLSVALVAAGVPIQPGNITVLAGPYAGRRLESGQARLSKVLLRLWGAPEKYASGPEAKKAIGSRRGVISFYHLWNAADPQGHIDLVGPDSWGEAVCADDCYWKSSEVWFWPLK